MLGGWLSNEFGSSFPYATLVINVTGSLVIGLVMGLASDRVAPWWWRPAVAVGFLGSYTTFSTFSYETMNLINEGSYLAATANMGGSVVAALLGVFAGLAIAKSYRRSGRCSDTAEARGSRSSAARRIRSATAPDIRRSSNCSAKEGAAGATVTRGIAGFGRGSLIHTAAILRLSLDLPLVITWIDAPERVERLMPAIQRLSGSGVITVEEVGIAQYGERAVGQMRFDLQIRDVMTAEVRSVRANVPVRHAVESLVGQAFRALPVVDDSGRLVGVVSNSDLIERGGLEARIELLGVMGERDREQYLKRLPDRPVSAVMTADPLTASRLQTLAEATRLLSERRLKRLPIVEPDGQLVGITSRADVLRAVAEAFPEPGASDRGAVAEDPHGPRCHADRCAHRGRRRGVARSRRRRLLDATEQGDRRRRSPAASSAS